MPRPITSGAAVATLLAALLLAACEEKAPEPPPPRSARVMEVTPQEMPFSGEASGQVAARYTTAVGFLIGGRMISRNVDVAASIKAGDLVAKLDPTDVQNQLAAAKADVTAAQAAVDQAGPEEAAKRKLLKDGFTTQSDYNNALKVLQSDQANLQSAQANEKLAEDQLNYATLTAPVSGVVSRRPGPRPARSCRPGRWWSRSPRPTSSTPSSRFPRRPRASRSSACR